jgi:hypothetical protein
MLWCDMCVYVPACFWHLQLAAHKKCVCAAPRIVSLATSPGDEANLRTLSVLASNGPYMALRYRFGFFVSHALTHCTHFMRLGDASGRSKCLQRDVK